MVISLLWWLLITIQLRLKQKSMKLSKMCGLGCFAVWFCGCGGIAHVFVCGLGGIALKLIVDTLVLSLVFNFVFIGLCRSSNLTTLCRTSSAVMSSSLPRVGTSGVPGVFKSLPSILSTLEKNSTEPGVVELLDIHSRESDVNLSGRNTSNHPLIVFEGLDGSGKSLLSKLTAKKLRGVKTSTPPESIQHLRPYFDKEGVDRVLRRAFYSLGNYLAAYKIQKLLENTPVVMDRFWHSTAAYAMAELKEGNEIPEDTFSWPLDLLQPDLVVFLSVSEDVRLERMSRRKNFTAEEYQLKENASYRERLTDAFAKMKSPSLEFINCDGVAKHAVDEVVTLLENKVGSVKKWPP